MRRSSLPFTLLMKRAPIFCTLLAFVFASNVLGIPRDEEGKVTLVVADGNTQIDARETPVVRLEALVEGNRAQRAQFSFSTGGKNTYLIDVDEKADDGFAADWSVRSLPLGDVEVSVILYDKRGRVAAASLPVRISGTAPAPRFTSPTNRAQVSGDVVLETTQETGTQHWASVLYEVGTDGENYTKIARVPAGNGGFAATWNVGDVPPGGYILRATVTDVEGTESATTIQVARVYKSDFLSDVPEGPIMLESFLSEKVSYPMDPKGTTKIELLNGTFIAKFDLDALKPQAAGRLHASLHLADANFPDEIFVSTSEVNPDQATRFTVAGLKAGAYRAVVHATYADEQRSYDIRSPIVDLVVVRDDEATGFNHESGQRLLDRIVSNAASPEGVGELTLRQGANEMVVVGGVRQGKDQELIATLADLQRTDATSRVTLNVANASSRAIEDKLLFAPYSWIADGVPEPGMAQEIPLSLAPGEITTATFEVEGTWGIAEKFGAFETSLASATEPLLQAFGIVTLNAETVLVQDVGVQFGGGFPALQVAVPLGFNLKTGYPEYHWVRGDSVRNVLPEGADPNATYTWTVTNTDGSTWGGSGPTLNKRAAILGGPHHLRVTCRNGGNTTVYGSEHYVHRACQSIVSTVTSVTEELECGKMITGWTGTPGPIAVTQSTSAEASVSVTSTVTGSVGNDAIGSVETSVGVTAGATVSEGTSVTYGPVDIPPGQCARILHLETYEVTRGTVVKTFTDGTQTTGTFEVRKLVGVSYKTEWRSC